MNLSKVALHVSLMIVLNWFFVPNPSYSDCTGCCADNGGVVCRNRITMCADGTSLSDECMKKECIKCPQGFFDGLDKDGTQKGIQIPDLKSSSITKFVVDKVVNAPTGSSIPSDAAPKQSGYHHACGPFDGKIKKCLHRGRLVYMNYGYPVVGAKDK